VSFRALGEKSFFGLDAGFKLNYYYVGH